LLLPVLIACSDIQDDSSSAFPGLQGPQSVSVIPGPLPRSSIQTYTNGSADSIGLYLTDESASWLGLVHGFKSIGLPFRVVTDLSRALEHDVLIVYPALTGSGSSAETLQSLAAHVRAGNTVMAFSVIGGGMQALFGFEDTVERRSLDAVTFQDSELSSVFLLHEAERSIPLESLSDDPNAVGAGLPGVSYSAPRHPAVALYGDGSAAITHNFFSTESGRLGHAYAIGFDIGHYILRAHNGRFTQFTRNYVNAYQPKVDSLLRFIAAVYQQGESDAVMFEPVPDGQSLVVLLTHDVDYTDSLLNTAAYAQAELAQSVPATYFIQTKYISDYNDSRFFDESSARRLQDLLAKGMEIASHSVAHSNEFRSMPVGSGAEQYPDYQPFVFDFETVNNATIMGELRVSKFLLEQVTGHPVKAFRPGHLSLPEQLPELLMASGYRYSSSITANEALTHLPYKLMVSRAYDTELDLYEFPVTIEDEQWRLQESLPEVLALAEAIGAHGGLMNVLIHTDTTGDKLEFQQRLVSALDGQAVFRTVGDFADWWAARDSLYISSLEKSDNRRLLHLYSAATINGLTLTLPPQWRFEGGIDGSVQQGQRLVLGAFSGPAQLLFSLREP
jgi:peptidoglycan/xylan/chitin deacetylase (PgdA/CDA1 family)